MGRTLVTPRTCDRTLFWMSEIEDSESNIMAVSISPNTLFIVAASALNAATVMQFGSTVG